MKPFLGNLLSSHVFTVAISAVCGVFWLLVSNGSRKKEGRENKVKSPRGLSLF